jgi:hypothetical protein
VAASFWVFQNTGSSLPVSCSISRANAQDNFSGTTLDVTLTCSPSSVPSGVWTQVIAKGTLSTSAITGLQFTTLVTGSLPAGTLFQTTLLQLEPGTAATPFEWRPYAYELAQCQRYLAICTTIETTSASAAAQQTAYWKVSLRTIPGSITNTGTSTWLPMGTDGARQTSNATVFGGSTLTASAEL